MLKRKFMIAIAFIAMIAFANTAAAQTVIYGCLDKVFMNSDKNPVHQNDVSPALHTKLTVNADGTYNLELSEFKVGNMPAKLKVVANNVKLDGTTNEYYNAIVLNIGGGMKFDAYITGNYNATTGNLEYTVESIDASFLGISFDTEVHFTKGCPTK